MEERLLVKRAKRGDVDAFGELYQQIYKKLYAYALYILKRPEDAEDVVGEAVVDAFATIGRLQKEDSFASWMYRIVANKCNRRMRDYYLEGEELTEQVLASTEVFADDWSDGGIHGDSERLLYAFQGRPHDCGDACIFWVYHKGNCFDDGMEREYRALQREPGTKETE